MSSTSITPREIWEEIYQEGHRQYYPWDNVVSFVFRNAPKDKPRDRVHVLEVGFGTGSNLWFAAREGFSVSGIEGSATAVEYAQKRFAEEGLSADLRIGDFAKLPFEDNQFNLVIDRGALTCVGRQGQMQAINEINRVLLPGGRFQYNGYADSHSSCRAGTLGPDGLRLGIDQGTLVGIGPIYFSSRLDIDAFFSERWKLLTVQRREWTDMLEASGNIHAEWLVVAEKL